MWTAHAESGITWLYRVVVTVKWTGSIPGWDLTPPIQEMRPGRLKAAAMNSWRRVNSPCFLASTKLIRFNHPGHVYEHLLSLPKLSTAMFFYWTKRLNYMTQSRISSSKKAKSKFKQFLSKVKIVSKAIFISV